MKKSAKLRRALPRSKIVAPVGLKPPRDTARELPFGPLTLDQYASSAPTGLLTPTGAIRKLRTNVSR